MLDIRPALYVLSSAVLLIVLLALRTIQTLLCTHSRRNWPAPRDSRKKTQNETATIALFLGSGGHTAEMLRIISAVGWKRYTKRIYIIAQGDTISVAKAIAHEKEIGEGAFEIIYIPRARHVHQSYLTAPFTTIQSLLTCLWKITLEPMLSKERIIADVLVTNGPGTCVPIALAAFLPRLFFLKSTSTIYIESFARLTRLSLSGKLVRPIVDRFFVQWEGLRDHLTAGDSDAEMDGRWRLKARAEYQGWLV